MHTCPLAKSPIHQAPRENAPWFSVGAKINRVADLHEGVYTWVYVYMGVCIYGCMYTWCLIYCRTMLGFGVGFATLSKHVL
jgi:hypothetical protein